MLKYIFSFIRKTFAGLVLLCTIVAVPSAYYLEKQSVLRESQRKAKLEIQELAYHIENYEKAMHKINPNMKPCGRSLADSNINGQHVYVKFPSFDTKNLSSTLNDYISITENTDMQNDKEKLLQKVLILERDKEAIEKFISLHNSICEQYNRDMTNKAYNYTTPPEEWAKQPLESHVNFMESAVQVPVSDELTFIRLTHFKIILTEFHDKYIQGELPLYWKEPVESGDLVKAL